MVVRYGGWAPFARKGDRVDIMGKLSRGALPRNGILSLGVAAAAAIVAVPLMVAGPSAAAAAAPSSGGEVNAFYRSRGGASLWFAPNSGAAAQQLIQLLATAQADRLNPRRYNVKGLTRAVQEAHSRSPGAVQRADMMLSNAFVAYARDMKHDPGVGIIYVDRELRPTPTSPIALLNAAAAAPSLSDYVGQMEWMSPIYA